MSALKITGLACPWNTYNTFNELMKPGAFSAFIARFKTRPHPLPMKLMHLDRCGEWTDLRETERGLEVTGFVETERGKLLVREWLLPELSISFRQTYNSYDTAVRETFKRNRTRPNWLQGDKRYVLAEKQDYASVELAEISLVDDGAFPGTHYEVLKDTDTAAETARAMFAEASR